MDWGLGTMLWLFGMLVGFGIGMVVTIGKTNKRREMRETALRKIVHHQWDSGINDAVLITRIAIKGLNGND